MAEYTYEDIIMDPEDPRLEGAIGKECYFADYPTKLLENARSNSSVVYWSRLKSVRKDEAYPFADKDGHTWILIIIKKEEPKPKYVPFETLDEFIESYKKAEERIAYSNTRDYIASCGMWLRFNNDDVMCAVTEIWTDGVFMGHDHLEIKWKELFNFYDFLDGSPCGKEVEE